MEKIKINSGIKEIGIYNEKDEIVTVLKINMADSNIITRFAKLLQNLNHVSDEFEKDAKRLAEKYKENPLSEETIDIEQIVDYSSANVLFLNKCIEEINGVFGENTIQNVYRECYEVTPDFVPDENALIEFVDGVVPVMNKLFGEKFEENKKRYSVSNRGKYVKAK